MDIGDIYNLLRPLAWKYATDVLRLSGSLGWKSETHILSLLGLPASL